MRFHALVEIKYGLESRNEETNAFYIMLLSNVYNGFQLFNISSFGGVHSYALFFFSC